MYYIIWKCRIIFIPEDNFWKFSTNSHLKYRKNKLYPAQFLPRNKNHPLPSVFATIGEEEEKLGRTHHPRSTGVKVKEWLGGRGLTDWSQATYRLWSGLTPKYSRTWRRAVYETLPPRWMRQFSAARWLSVSWDAYEHVLGESQSSHRLE